MSRSQDLLSLLKGLQLITEAGVKLQEKNIKLIWQNSSLRALSDIDIISSSKSKDTNLGDTLNNLNETASRISTVAHSFKEYVTLSYQAPHSNQTVKSNVNSSILNKNSSFYQENIQKSDPQKQNLSHHFDIKLSESDIELLKKLDMEHKKKIQEMEEQKKEKQTPTPKTKKKFESKQSLSENAKQRKVPSSRVGRMVSFGSLAAGLGVGTLAEYARRTLGISSSKDASTLFMTEANLERIVDTLCKVRGAALKLGQIMSIQDESVVHPDLAKALERVRKSADFMPDWQVEQVMATELGDNWRDKLLDFQMRPFAAASIGQVHWGKLKDGQEVAIKIQYPGVAKGINSDIDNLGAILNMWNVFPKGMFLENLMTVAKRELAWEVDYEREAECTKKFRTLLENYHDYYVPKVVDELSTKQVFTTELLDGIPVDQCFDLDIEHRQIIGNKIMELCLLEILQFRYMQTDPNWANFLYSPSKKQLLLLDFGASREYSKEFMDKYVRILKAASDLDRDTVLILSRDLGFLTGYESKIMENAHVDAVMILGEVFRKDQGYDFSEQDMTQRIQELAQVMLQHRLCPPPEEVYSLHRKLSGLFLLCAKLKIKINCRDKFLMLYDQYMKQSR